MDRANIRHGLLRWAGYMLAMGGTVPSAPAARVTWDIPYESPGGEHNLLDVYLPDNDPAPDTPTILFIHGGGWSGGDKSGHELFLTTTADAGYPIVTCNYTLSTEDQASYPQAVYDVKAVVRWIRQQGPLYGLPWSIVAVGNSAGGHLAMMLGATAGVEEFEPLAPPPDGYALQAVVSFFGPADLILQMEGIGNHEAVEQFLGVAFHRDTRERFKEASPITYVTVDDAPMAFFHGRLDNTVPFEQSVQMEAALTGMGVFSRLTLVDDATHSFAGFGGQDGAARRMIDVIPTLLAAEGPDTPPVPRGGPPTCGAGLVALVPLGLLARLKYRPPPGGGGGMQRLRSRSRPSPPSGAG